MKTIKKSYKFRIYPNNTQQIKLSKTFGCVRFIWNQLVEDFNNYKETEVQKTDKTVVEIKKEFNFLSEVSCAVLQQKHRDFLSFKQQFFSKNRKIKTGIPTFKKRGVNDSFRIPKQGFYIKENRIHLEKVGKVKIILDRKFSKETEFLSVAVRKNTCNQYYVSILVEEIVCPKSTTGKTVGIDLGIKTFVVTSDNQQIESPKFFRKNQAKLTESQRWLSKKKKGSRRWKRQKTKVAKIHLKITNQRRYFLHQVTNNLVIEYQCLIIEDLNVGGMVKNKNLSKSIMDASFGLFRSQLIYKCNWHERELITVDRFFPSSKTCSGCGNKKQDLSLKERIYNCASCGLAINRDLNAAVNLKVEGLRLLKTA